MGTCGAEAGTAEERGAGARVGLAGYKLEGRRAENV